MGGVDVVEAFLLAAAGALIVGGVPVRAHQASEAEAQVQAEQAADRAVAEARAEVLAEAQGEADAIRPVTISDVREGSAVHDAQGGVVGTVESVDEPARGQHRPCAGRCRSAASAATAAAWSSR